MAYKFTKEDREVANQEQTERMPFGVNTVKIVGATYGETDAGKEFLEIEVKNADGLVDSARVWFTGKASPYSLQTVQQIVVHSAKEADKEKARQAVQNAVDGNALADIINKRCVGAEAWLTKYYDATRTYTNQNGETKRSINTNIVGYEPKLKPSLMPEDSKSTDQVSDEALDNLGTKVEASTVNIPSNW